MLNRIVLTRFPDRGYSVQLPQKIDILDEVDRLYMINYNLGVFENMQALDV